MNNLGDAIRKISQKTDQRQYATQGIVRDIYGQYISVEPLLSDVDLGRYENGVYIPGVGKKENYITNVKVIPFIQEGKTQTKSVPALGSQVIIFYLNDYEPFVAMAGDTITYNITTNATSIVQSVNDDGVDDPEITGPFIKIISPKIYIGDSDTGSDGMDDGVRVSHIASNQSVMLLYLGDDGMSMIGGADTGVLSVTNTGKLEIKNQLADLKSILRDLITELKTVINAGVTTPAGPGTLTGASTFGTAMSIITNSIDDLLK